MKLWKTGIATLIISEAYYLPCTDQCTLVEIYAAIIIILVRCLNMCHNQLICVFCMVKALYSVHIRNKESTCLGIIKNAPLIQRFSFECRKVIGFAFTTLRDWLKRFMPLFHPIRRKSKTNCVIASRAFRQLHVITSSFDWFTVLSVFFVIG